MSIDSANESRFKKGIMVLSPVEGELLEALEALFESIDGAPTCEADIDEITDDLKQAFRKSWAAIAKAYGETL